MQPAEHGGIDLFLRLFGIKRRGVELQRNLRDECGAHALFADHGDGAAHGIHEFFHDGKAEPCTLIRSACTGIFLRERLKHMLLEFFAHAAAVIFTDKAVANGVLCL